MKPNKSIFFLIMMSVCFSSSSEGMDFLDEVLAAVQARREGRAVPASAASARRAQPVAQRQAPGQQSATPVAGQEEQLRQPESIVALLREEIECSIRDISGIEVADPELYTTISYLSRLLLNREADESYNLYFCTFRALIERAQKALLPREDNSEGI